MNLKLRSKNQILERDVFSKNCDFSFKIGQFAFIFIHAFQLVFSNECNYPMAFVYFIGGHAVLFYVLVKNKMVSSTKLFDLIVF
jgi:hypothetical protein